jgi:hypothetical protein
MGAWGESLEINDSTYTCIRYFSVSFWVKSS